MKHSLSFACLLLTVLAVSCKKSDNNPSPSTPPPAVSAINPTSGKKSTSVTITGSNFGTDISKVSVSFNGAAATVQSVSATNIVATVPAGAGTGQVQVTISAQSANGPVFTYIKSVTVSTLAGNRTQGYQDGTGTAAIFNYPFGIASDTVGNLYVIDQGLTVRKVTPAGVVSTIAGSYGIAAHVDASGGSARFTGPDGISIDPTGTLLYVGERNYNCIRKVTTAGVVTTLAHSTQQSFADGPLATALFSAPDYSVTDAQGNIFFSDDLNNRIRKISTAGIVSTIAGNGTSGTANGTAIGPTIGFPLGMTMDAQGNIYFCEDNNSSIRKISTTGSVSTIAGGMQGYADGLGAAAQFSEPFGIVVDKSGIIYAADRNNNCIRMIAADGTVTTIAGSGTLGQGFKDGDGSVAIFNNPTGLAIDAKGNLYVADQRNHLIRKIVME